MNLRPHRRANPLTGEWVLVSPQRATRPWQGHVEEAQDEERARFDDTCYLCPGVERANGDTNPRYTGTYVFENDFPALLTAPCEDADAATLNKYDLSIPGSSALFQQQTVGGECRVICFSPRHDLTLAELDEAALIDVVQTWRAQHTELQTMYDWVQIFENKGAINGCSNPHPHGQIWASNGLPTIANAEARHQQNYFEVHGAALLADYAREEALSGERVVVANEHWLVVAPFWAVWPFETLLLPRFPIARMSELSDAQCESLAKILNAITVRYDNLFNTSFPYSMGWHSAPGTSPAPHWQLHAHFYPPLLRSATIRKFMVGYEMLSEAQRDLTPEQAAERLTALSGIHYRLART